MTDIDKRSVEIPDEDADFVDGLVSSGRYASAEEVVSAGISALRERNGDFDDWLREVALPTAEEMTAHPERGLPAEQVFSDIRREHERRLKRRG